VGTPHFDETDVLETVHFNLSVRYHRGTGLYCCYGIAVEYGPDGQPTDSTSLHLLDETEGDAARECITGLIRRLALEFLER